MTSADKQPAILPMLIVGIGTLGAWVKIGQLSLYFNFGEGLLARPIPMVVGLLLIASALYIAGYVIVRRWPAARWYAAFIIAVGLLSRLALIPSHMIEASDAYRYIWDGQIQHAGLNPYRYAPEYVRKVWDYRRTIDAPREVEQFIESIRGIKGTRTLLNWVGNRELVTLYPPLAQMTFYIATAITPWDLMGMRLVFLSFDLATWFLVGWLLRRASPSRFLSGLLLYGWSPLVLKEVVNALHYESLTGLLLAVLVWLLVFSGYRMRARNRVNNTPTGNPALAPRPTQTMDLVRCLGASAALGLAVAARLYPLLLLPLVAAVQFRRHFLLPLGGLIVTLIVTGGLYAVYYAPDVHFSSVLDRSVTEWERNATLHPLTVRLIESIGTERFQPWIPQRFQQRAAPFAASVCLGVILALVLGALTWRLAHRPAQREAFLNYAVVAVVLAFCFASAQHPWYLVGIVPLLALQRRPFMSVILLTGLLSLCYLNFYVAYHCGNLADPECRRQLLLIRLAQFVPFYLAAIVEIGYRLRRRAT